MVDFFYLFFCRRDHGRLPAQAFKAMLAHVDKKEGGKIHVRVSHEDVCLCLHIIYVCT